MVYKTIAQPLIAVGSLLYVRPSHLKLEMDYIKTQSHGVFKFSVSSENLKYTLRGSVPLCLKKITRKIRHTFGGFIISLYFCLQKISNMGKLAFLLCFILSVYPADVNENRRHIHVVRRGSKKSHRGNTVAKIWIEENGEKKIEIAWSELSADEETMILDAIEKHWILLNKQIDDVFAGKKIKIVTLKK